MKTCAIILVAAGLASAASPLAARQSNASTVSDAENNAKEGVVQTGSVAAEPASASSGLDAASLLSGANSNGLDLASLLSGGSNNADILNCLNLGDLNLQGLEGLNLGSDVLNIDQLLTGSSSIDQLLAQELGGLNFGSGIEELLGDMGLGNLIAIQQLEQLSLFEQLEMFLMLEQLMQLLAVGFVNQAQVLALLTGNVFSGNNFGNFNDFANSFTNFNFGVFKRNVEVLKAVSFSHGSMSHRLLMLIM